ncbi:hypothetical protein FS837_000169 [Tulasnella sp. UAMH 9824]|nr:hypothetical protein FS837_000169 [Tulasnella sp. UAMH 9824]
MKPTRKSSSSSDAPVADDMIRLNFSKNSVYNTIISSEDNEIMYEVSTPNIWSFTKSVTTVMKLEKTSEQKVFVGEIGWRGLHHRIVVRIGSQNIEWLLAKVWLTNSKEYQQRRPLMRHKEFPTDGKPVGSSIMHVRF